MLLIQGEEIHDTWQSYVLSTDGVNKTVDVFFYIESNRPNFFVRETQGRHGRNTVPQESVLGIANGNWISHSQWQKQQQKF